MLFAAVSGRGWQVIDLSGVLGSATGATGPGKETYPLALSAAREWETAFTSAAVLGQPADLSSSALAAVCPQLAADGVRRLVAVPVYGPTGAASVIVATYPAGADGAADDFLGPSTETVGCMGTFLLRAYGPTCRPPPVPVRGFKPMSTAREVATIFGVTSRTVSNWVASGTLAAPRTAGGHLRFTADDVEVLHGRLLARPKVGT